MADMAEGPLLYDEEGVLEQVPIGRTTLYSLYASGELETVKIGRRRLVPRESLERFVARLRAEQNGPSAA